MLTDLFENLRLDASDVLVQSRTILTIVLTDVQHRWLEVRLKQIRIIQKLNQTTQWL